MLALRKNLKNALALWGAWTLIAFAITKLADHQTNKS